MAPMNINPASAAAAVAAVEDNSKPIKRGAERLIFSLDGLQTTPRG